MTTIAPPVEPASRLVPAAELGLVGLTLAAVYGFSRVFDHISFAPYLVSVALFAHGTSAVARRRGWPVGVTATFGLLGTVLLCTWMLFPATTVAGLPTGTTLEVLRFELVAAWESFPTAVPPTEPLAGFIVVSCLAVFAAAFLADWAAFRLWSVFEALVPASTLFLFCTLLGAGNGIDATAIFLGAALLFVLLHRGARNEGASAWIGSTTPTPGQATTGAPARERLGTAGLRAGVLLATAAVFVGVVGGDRLPGAHSDGLVDWRGRNSGAGTRSVLSPLINIRDRLVQQSNAQVFTVETGAENRAYWRLTALDVFDGSTWQAKNTFDQADGDLGSPPPADVRARTVRQTYRISGLNAAWVPGALEPTRLENSTESLEWDDESSTLIPSDRDLSEGLQYTLDSVVPSFTRDQLAGVRDADIPAEIRNRYTKLPRPFNRRIREQAEEIVQGASSPYEKARRLQDFFREEFTYSTEFDLQHNQDAILRFLEIKKGFCEQFAGAFGAMARSIGLPTRVAVGFTPGVRDDANNRWVVRGQQAHAWPEVYLGEHFGWVPFEPTPGRGIPGGEPWTDVPESQDTSGTGTPGSSAAPAPIPTTTTTAASTPPGTTQIDVTPEEEPPPVTEPEPTAETGGGADEIDRDSLAYRLGQFLGPFVGRSLVLLLIVGAIGGYYLVVSQLKRARRERRRQRAVDGSARTRVAWAECLEALALIGLAPRATETAEEFAHRVAPSIGEAGPALVALAGDVEFATFAPELLDDDAAARAGVAAATVIAAAQARVRAVDEWLDRFDPRPLLGTAKPRRREPVGTGS